MPGSLLGSISSPMYGAFYDRAGATKPLTIGSISFFVVMVIFSIMAPSITSMTAGVAEVPREVSGDVNAIFNTIQQFAGAVGTAVAALFIKTTSTTPAEIAHQTATGLGHLFWFSTVFAGLSLIWLFGFTKTKTGK